MDDLLVTLKSTLSTPSQEASLVLERVSRSEVRLYLTMRRIGRSRFQQIVFDGSRLVHTLALEGAQRDLGRCGLSSAFLVTVIVDTFYEMQYKLLRECKSEAVFTLKVC